MAYKVEFLETYPKLLEKFFLEMDDELTDEWLRVIYEGCKGLICAQENIDEKIFDESMKYHRIENPYISSDDTDAQFFWTLMMYVHFGDQQSARNLLRMHLSEMIKTSALHFAFENVKKLAYAGERFFNSDGHNKRAQSIRERNQKIAEEFTKLVNNGSDKAAVYSKLENTYSLTTRQLQRVIKKLKSDI